MIKTLLWDLDNTLLDFPAAERQAIQQAFAAFRLGPCPEDRVARYAALNDRYWKRLERGGDHQGPAAHPAVRGVLPGRGHRRAGPRRLQPHLPGLPGGDGGLSRPQRRPPPGPPRPGAAVPGHQRGPGGSRRKSWPAPAWGPFWTGCSSPRTSGRRSPAWTSSGRCSRPWGTRPGRSSSWWGTPSPATWPGDSGRGFPAAGTTPKGVPLPPGHGHPVRHPGPQRSAGHRGQHAIRQVTRERQRGVPGFFMGRVIPPGGRSGRRSGWQPPGRGPGSPQTGHRSGRRSLCR